MIRPVLALLFAAVAPAQDTYLVRFGVDAGAPRDWSGEVVGATAVDPWQFDQGDSLSGSSWRARTAVDEYWHAPWERSLFGTKRLEKLSERGLIVTGATDRLSFETAAGEFGFSGRQIGWGSPMRFLDGAVEVSRVPDIERISGVGAEDFPALLVGSDGNEWIAWQSYTVGGDRLWVQRGAEAPEPLTPPDRSLFRVELAEDRSGEVWAVWSEMRERNWDLYARVWSAGSWSEEKRLTEAPGSDIFHVLAADDTGRIYLAWQSLRAGQGDIYLRILQQGSWSEEIRVTSDPANDWEPAIAARGGRAALAWDSYRNGNYDIYIRFIDDGELSEQFRDRRDAVVRGATFNCFRRPGSAVAGLGGRRFAVGQGLRQRHQRSRHGAADETTDARRRLVRRLVARTPRRAGGDRSRGVRSFVGRAAHRTGRRRQPMGALSLPHQHASPAQTHLPHDVAAGSDDVSRRALDACDPLPARLWPHGLADRGRSESGGRADRGLAGRRAQLPGGLSSRAGSVPRDPAPRSAGRQRERTGRLSFPDREFRSRPPGRSRRSRTSTELSRASRRARVAHRARRHASPHRPVLGRQSRRLAVRLLPLFDGRGSDGLPGRRRPRRRRGRRPPLAKDPASRGPVRDAGGVCAPVWL